MAVPYYKQYQARHKPGKRIGAGRQTGGQEFCETCHYLLKCKARINNMDWWPYCFVCSPFHRYYVRRYGKQLEGAQA